MTHEPGLWLNWELPTAGGHTAFSWLDQTDTTLTQIKMAAITRPRPSKRTLTSWSGRQEAGPVLGVEAEDQRDGR